MTEKEMAQEYEKNAECIEIDDYGHKVYGSQDIEQAFLAGLKAGRPKFHKVIDGYMPPRDKFYDTINVLTDKGDIAYYSYNFDCWVAKPSSMEIEPPIAWCEIPKYTEE